MIMVRFHAGYERVQPFQPVHQAVLEQKIQRPVDGRGNSGFAGGTELVEELVGGQRRVGGQDEVQHLTAQGGKLRALGPAMGFGLFQPGIN